MITSFKDKPIPEMNGEYRNTIRDLIHFGSDLNKFVNEKCTHQMTAINVDLLMYKRTKQHVRIIESKHRNESAGYGQKDVLNLLAKATIDDIILEVFVVCSDYPFNESIITDLSTGEVFTLNQQELIDWLEFKPVIRK